MIKSIVKHGNSQAIIIDRPILDLLKIDESTKLDISTDGVSLIITPVSGASRDARFDAAMRRTVAKHKGLLVKLAEEEAANPKNQ
ncbi:MAG: AbrB/MazE/SpoVT family DNA-binding domain-containing protein [Candidatus Obscuribacterales bacterium]|nr:AbrB/MazE/SpoVT family DNA-binding domain-containing protein [Candidatus Obscuribacterales bacterium]